jgi:hypothetical protein
MDQGRAIKKTFERQREKGNQKQVEEVEDPD